MSDDLIRFVFTAHLASTLFMVGLIWFVQLVHYPLFARVGELNFSTYEQHHTRAIRMIVAPAMLLEGVTAVLLFWFRPLGAMAWVQSIGLILLIIIWLSTAVIQVPCHKVLSSGFNLAAHQRLMTTNWLRTLCWSARGLMVLWMSWNSLVPSDVSSTLTTLKVGDHAPLFSATTSDGKLVSLSDYTGKRGVVLFFYPKDGTSVCTKEACAFRDSYEKFSAAGVEVIGVSSDTDESHREFAEQNRLSFPLISDADGVLRKAYSVPSTLGLIPGRVTYVIDKDGRIQLIFSALMASDEHVRKALLAVRGSSSLP